MVCAILVFTDRTRTDWIKLLQMIQLAVGGKASFVLSCILLQSQYPSLLCYLMSIVLALKKMLSIVSSSELSLPQCTFLLSSSLLDNRSKQLQQKRHVYDFSHHCGKTPNKSSVRRKGLFWLLA